MTILHISTRLILGGSQENTVLSCEGQARLGHRVHLAFGPIFGPEGSLLARVQGFNERCARAQERTGAGEPCTPIGIHEVPDLCREVSPSRDRRCLAQLRELIERLEPDIVHTHSSKAGILGRIAAWKLNTSNPDRSWMPCGIIHTIHGPPFMPIEGSLVRRLKIRAINLVYTLAERHAANSCHVIASVADAMTQQFLARGIGRPEQYVTVFSGMEVERYLHAADAEDRAAMRKALGFADEDFVIGTVARLAEHKGHDDILDAITSDLKAHPNWKLLWVGDGWWRDRLLARVTGEGLAGRVVTTGLVPSERVPAHMRAMDVLVHPSYREGLPRTVPQALLCGVPVVAYDVDGTREACIEGETGRLVPLSDRNRLREAIAWMYDHPHERAEMARRGREMCADRFSTRRMIAHLEEVYERAVRQARAK